MHRLFLAAVVATVMVSAVLSQRMTTTEGRSGTACGRRQRRCLSFATCVGGRCQCPPGFFGNGAFGCFPWWFYESDVIGDPETLTFGKEHIETPLPCRTLYTHVVTDFSTDTGAEGTCEFKLYTFNTRVLGKFFTSGFDAYFDINDKTSGTSKTVAFRVAAEAMNGTYTFYEWGKADGQSAGPWGAYQDVTYFGQRFWITYEHIDNRAALDIDACGIMLTFRPADFGEKSTEQSQIPGICVAIESKQQVQWKSQDKVISLPPKSVNGPTVGSVSTALKMSPIHAFIYRALVAPMDQEFPGAAQDECVALSNTVMMKCNDPLPRQDAFEMCSYIITTHKFARCWSEPEPRSVAAILDLYKNCLEAWCAEDDAKCNTTVTEVRDSTCSQHAKAEMVEFDCVYHPA